MKSIKKNYIYNLSYQILILITPLITTPYISRILGADGVGSVSYAESIVSYFTLFGALGITTYGQREISYVQELQEKRSSIFWNTKILECVTGGIALFIYLIFAGTRENVFLYLVFAFNIAAVIVDVTWFFQGIEEFGKIVFRNIVIKIVSIAYIFVFIRTKEDVVKYAFGIAFFTFLSNISLWRYIPKYVGKVKHIALHPFSDIKMVVSLFIPTIAIQVYTVLDKTMIGMITKSAFENGYYEQALKISRIVLTVVTALGTVMIPRIGFYYQQGKRKEVERLMYRGYRFVWFLGIPLCFGLIMVSRNFVPWFFGSGFDKVSNLIDILAFLILAIGINNVTGMQYLIPTKRQNTFTVTVIIGAIINFAINLLLIPQIQSLGAGIGSVIAELVIAILQIIIVRKELKPVQILKESINYIPAGIAMVVALYFEGKYLTPSVIHTTLMILTGMVVYFGVLLIIRDEFFIGNINIILKKVRGK